MTKQEWKMERRRKDLLMANTCIWMLLTIFYCGIYFSYRIKLVETIILSAIYIAVTAFLIIKHMKEKQNKLIWITLIVIILATLNLMTYQTYLIEQRNTDAYHQYLEELPENMLLKAHDGQQQNQ